MKYCRFCYNEFDTDEDLCPICGEEPMEELDDDCDEEDDLDENDSLDADEIITMMMITGIL